MLKTINLIDKDKSDIPYEIFTFPDGEPHIKLTQELNRKEEYKVLCRITNPTELFIVLQIGNILDMHAVDWYLGITYLMSQRMDRVMTFNEPFSLQIVTSVLSSLHYHQVHVFEPHSCRMYSLLRNCFSLINAENKFNDCNLRLDHDLVCFPDKSAFDKYNKGGTNYLVCDKVRDANTGRIISYEVSRSEYDKKDIKSILVSDDLCDGGSTFILAYNKLKELYPDAKISLYVRHMVNPKGIETVSKVFDKVYFTNSYRDWNACDIPDNCVVIDMFKDRKWEEAE